MHVISHGELEQILTSTRAAREHGADLTRRTQHARLELQWQRMRARKQIGELEQVLDALRLTVAELCPVPGRLVWRSPDGAFDDVLVLHD